MVRATTMLTLVSAMATTGCDGRAPTTAPPGPAPAPLPTGASSDAASAKPAASGDRDPCSAAIAKFDELLERGSRACTKDEDCACYPGGIGSKSGCGGVTAKATAHELHAIAKQYLDNGCRHTQLCAAWACQPKCAEENCRR